MVGSMLNSLNMSGGSVYSEVQVEQDLTCPGWPAWGPVQDPHAVNRITYRYD